MATPDDEIQDILDKLREFEIGLQEFRGEHISFLNSQRLVSTVQADVGAILQTPAQIQSLQDDLIGCINRMTRAFKDLNAIGKNIQTIKDYVVNRQTDKNRDATEIRRLKHTINQLRPSAEQAQPLKDRIRDLTSQLNRASAQADILQAIRLSANDEADLERLRRLETQYNNGLEQQKNQAIEQKVLKRQQLHMQKVIEESHSIDEIKNTLTNVRNDLANLRDMKNSLEDIGR